MRVQIINLKLLILSGICFLPLYCKVNNDNTGQDKNINITPKIYSNMLARKREEHKFFVKHLLKSEYEKNHKILTLGFDKIFEVLKESNVTINQAMYYPKNGFPTDERLQSAVTLIIENICLAGEIVIHLPELCYNVLKKQQNWKNIFLWGTDFVNEYPQIIAEETAIMLNLFRQEINDNERTEDYINPYKNENINLENENNVKINMKKAKKKRIKKGPQLSRTEL